MSRRDRLTFGTVRLAAVQAELVLLDLDAAAAKAIALIEQAAAQGAELIGFPEGYVPMFPNWYETLGEGEPSRELDRELFKHSLEIPGTHIEAIADACRRGRIAAVVGVNERLPGTTGTMYNTQVFIDRDGEIVGKHQKYVATASERLVHGPGRTGHENTFAAHFGTVSGLICGENSNPLGMYAAALQYPLVHVASWPAYFRPGVPMHHAVSTATAGLAYALKSYAIASVSRISDSYLESLPFAADDRDYIRSQQDLNRGAVIFDYCGRVLVDGSGNDADIIVADVDLEDVIVPKMIHDVAGHYNRPELFAPLFD